MKKLIAAVVLYAFANPILAGEAVIPFWSKWPSETTCLSVSNISNSDVNFKVTLFDQSGSKYLGAIEFANNISALDQESTLPAKETAYFCLKTSSGGSYGFGQIVTSEVEGSVGKSFVLAHSRQVLSTNHSSAVLINNGLPF